MTGQTHISKFIKYLYIFLGLLFLVLAVIGIFVPVLPTTPFLLLTAFFFLRSSERLYQWLLSHKVFGPYLHNYIRYRAMTIKAKRAAIATLWLSLAISIYLVNKTYVDIILIVIGISVSCYILSIKTLHKAVETDKAD